MTVGVAEKPMNRKAYGSIPHLPGSRRGPSDRGVNDGQARICLERARDQADIVIVQEKLDGTNVAVYKVDEMIFPLIRAGYRAEDSRRRMHHMFAAWVYERQASFHRLLKCGERICGEWLAQAHGTRYDLTGRSPFVAFDIMREDEREPFDEFQFRTEWCVDSELFDIPPLLHLGKPLPLNDALAALGERGRYGATDPAEGVVYRVERRERGKGSRVDFLAKYVRPEKRDGIYLPGVTGAVSEVDVWNWGG